MATTMPLDAGQGRRDSSSAPPWAESARRQRRAYAALDLGTNNCRLLIARPARQGFYVVDAFSRIVRLGEGLIQSGKLSEAAQDRAVEALKICADKLRRRDVHIARNVATEACRRATNGAAFIERVYAETGIALDVITSAEEARLAVLGCQTLIEPGTEQALVFDIGGGSTELILVDLCPRGLVDIKAWTSVPWGVVSLAETEPLHFDSTEARLEAYARKKQRVMDHLSGFAASIASQLRPGLQMLGTSGTITTLASLHLGLPSYDRRQVDGCWVPHGSMRDISSMLASKSPADRARVPCIGTERADLVVAGCAILEAILDAWPGEKLRVADRGIREGILRTLMGRDGYHV
ncbi:Ppx/GppA phosphatase family protein [Sphingoaurantiacus capsulatus]|uniref:Ppx/GppA phosphatase family protein n=1 Tax=Sphingoaurantiacus capsulatus TaxID=1771310 RepID=A0ABV7XE74_9SPHN